MTIQHAAIADADLHEPKGVAAAALGKIYVANGTGSGTWQHTSPHAGCVNNVFTGTAVAALAAADTYYPLNFTTASTNLHDFTHTSPARLTYTGPDDRDLHMVFNMSFEATATSGIAVTAIFKNGVILDNSRVRRAFVNASAGNIAMHFDDQAVTGDYYDVRWMHVTTARATIVYGMYFYISGMQA